MQTKQIEIHNKIVESINNFDLEQESNKISYRDFFVTDSFGLMLSFIGSFLLLGMLFEAGII